MRAIWICVAMLGCGDGSGPGDGCPDFTVLTGASERLDATTITAALDVAGMPGELTIDRADVAAFVLEYAWAIDIDVDADGSADYQLAATHFKTDGAERTVTDVLGAMQVDLWSLAGAGGTIAGDATATLAPIGSDGGQRLTFTVQRSEDAGLADVGAGSRFTATTYYQFGAGLGDRCADSFAVP